MTDDEMSQITENKLMYTAIKILSSLSEKRPFYFSYQCVLHVDISEVNTEFRDATSHQTAHCQQLNLSIFVSIAKLFSSSLQRVTVNQTA